MEFSFTPPTPLEFFATLVHSDADFPLLEAAVSLAQDEYPELDVQMVLEEVDLLLARLQRRVAADAGPLQKLRLLNQFFFRELNFAGNVNHFDDPGNSYVSVVLGTRRAIPITLAVLWLELAQGLGLAASGVGFPGHFMVKVKLPKGQVVLDPLDGQSLSQDDLEQRLIPFRLDLGLLDKFSIPLGLYLQASTPREIIARMLRNLKKIYLAQEDWRRLIAVQDRLIVLMPKVWVEYRDRGLAHAMAGQALSALRDLEVYLANNESNQDMPAISSQVAALKLMKD
jgi:regulator of sirC expression with transglutaminase-like and TPR domain